MIILTGYEIKEKIYEAGKILLYRGISSRTKQPLMIKVLKEEYPTIEEITGLRQEYQLINNLECAGIIKPYKLENYQNSLALVLEDFGGQPLSHLLQVTQLSVIEFLTIAITLAETLIHLHKVPIIHKNIQTSNILINPQNKVVKLTGFSSAITLSREQQIINNPHLLQDSLAYISPEQTGRMNRSLDYRTDFYSLGVTFYEMLTGTIPFTTTDPIELVHCHIAKQPVLLEQFQIPKSVSDIVMKLMAKNAEERYQSAAGLKFDLENCLIQLERTGNIEHFTLGERDRGSQLLLPQKLYGREREVQTLIDAFARVAQGATEIMLVSGYSGIGKTSIVNEVHKPIVEARGYFITGKFDQFKRNIPYAALIQAFDELIRQLLTESAEQIAIWQKKLLNALEHNGQVIINLIPSLELLIGIQPKVTQLGALESQNRFNQLFHKFINVFCQPEHPLVIFLDDLQWADIASLKLIQLLLTDDSSQYLLMIGAYRDNEVSLTHPLIELLEKLKSIVVNKIILKPLSYLYFTEFIKETLGKNVDIFHIQILAILIFNKTQGNPFFLTQLIQSLYVNGLLNYHVDIDRWEWDIKQIQAIGITDYNIVELITANICKLPPDTQKVIKIAACIGNYFNLEILSVFNKKSELTTAQELWPALQAGLILPQSDTYKVPLVFTESEALSMNVQNVRVDYKFLHDRVHQAAYSLIPDSEKKVTHQKIGQLLLNNTTLEKQKDYIFTIVNQLNFGVDLLTTQIEKDELAKLNLAAGQKAKMATAYEATINYFNTALEILGADCWKNQYHLTFTLYLQLSEVQYLNTNLEQAAILCDIAFKQVETALEKVKLYEIKIRLALAQNQIQFAVEMGLQALEILEVSLSQSSPVELNLHELAKLPRMTDTHKLVAMEILMLIHPPACFGESTLGVTILYTMIELSRLYGNSTPSVYAYAVYGALTSWLVPDIDFAYQLGQLARLVLAQLDAKEFESMTSVIVSITITHWKRHIRETIEPLFQAIQSGLENGDIEFACYAANFYCSHLFFNSNDLEDIQKKQRRYIPFIKSFQQEHQLYLASILGQLVANLMEQSTEKMRLSGEFIHEDETLIDLHKNNNLLAIFSIYFAKCLLCYLFKNYPNSVEYARIGSKYSGFVQGEIIFTQHNFYYSLALLANYLHPNSQASLGEESQQEELLKQVALNQEKMKYWAHNCPMNYQHKYDLVEAEKARVLGQIIPAMEYYDRAIQGANEQGYIQEEALAYELAAKFYLAQGREKIAQFYMKNSYHCYARWGAVAKVKDLETEYPQFLTQAKKQLGVKAISMTSSGSTDLEVLDLTTVVKASQVLAGEIILDKLLAKLMKIMIENAGAQKGFLILHKEDNLVIEAEGTVDSDNVTTLQSISLNSVKPDTQIPLLSVAIINYVSRTQENVVLNDATHEGKFTRDSYIVTTQAKSILCTPLIHQGKLSGILYLENNLTTGAFTSDRVEVLRILSAQAAISIENSRLYEQLEGYSRNLEQKVEARTQELQEKNQELASILQTLKATQAQIIAQEKLASLGALTAGIAHEMKNPLNFVNNFAELSIELTQELLIEIENQKDRLDSESREYIEEILNDLQQNAQKIHEHGMRSDNIVNGMLMHSRGQLGKRQLTGINTLLAEAIELAYHTTRAKDASFKITIETNYDHDLGQLNIVPQNISCALINIVNNASYAAYKKKMRLRAELGYQKSEEFVPQLSVSTKNLREQVEIRIRDNGEGIPQEVLDKIFNPFFTTKPAGEGTGLGLSITHDIIVQQHQGRIEVETEIDNYTEFIITLPKLVSKNNESEKI